MPPIIRLDVREIQQFQSSNQYFINKKNLGIENPKYDPIILEWYDYIVGLQWNKILKKKFLVSLIKEERG